MFGFRCKTEFREKTLKKKSDQGFFKSLGHAAATIRLIAVRSIRRGKKPSAPGKPPHTKTKRLPRSIKYVADQKRLYAIVGADADVVGTAGQAHEHGGRYKKETFDKRPFMMPAFEKARPRLPPMWANSIR